MLLQKPVDADGKRISQEKGQYHTAEEKGSQHSQIDQQTNTALVVQSLQPAVPEK